MELRIHRLAVAEIDHEVDYYESRQPGLGDELEDEIDAVVAMILRFPKPRRSGKIVSIDAWRRLIVFRSRCRTRSSARRL